MRLIPINRYSEDAYEITIGPSLSTESYIPIQMNSKDVHESTIVPSGTMTTYSSTSGTIFLSDTSSPIPIGRELNGPSEIESAVLGAGGALILFLLGCLFRCVVKGYRKRQHRYNVTSSRKLNDAELIGIEDIEPQLSCSPPPPPPPPLPQPIQPVVQVNRVPLPQVNHSRGLTDAQLLSQRLLGAQLSEIYAKRN